MANSDKNIRITTSKNRTTYPKVVFSGSSAGASVITLEVLDDNTLSFTSNEGQVFSIDSNLSVGTIWAVSDISGIPILSASAGGTIGLAVYGGVVGIGQTNPTYKLDLKGNFGLASSNDGLYNFIFSNSAASGSNNLQIRSANSLLLYNAGNTFYTGLKSNAASNVTYTLPTTDGSADQFLKTNGSGVLSWGTPSGGSGGGGTGVGAGGQYEIAYYPATGSSVVGSNTFLNNTSTGVVSITHSTSSTNYTNGALTVTGGVGIGGSLFVGGTGSSISGVRIASGAITAGTWNGTNISTTYGGTGQNFSSSTGLVQISSGTASVITTSSSLASIISDETGSGSLVFNISPSFGTGVTTNSATFAVFNTNATTINAFGAATILSIGASTGKATFNSTDNSTSTTTGAIAILGGAGIAQSISVGGRLQLFNGANYTAFVSSASGNTVYTLPATTPATGSSVLSSTPEGVMSWVAVASGSGSATTAANIQINTLGNPNSFHPVLMTPVQASAGSAVSANGTVVYNPSTDILYTPGFAVTSGVDSTNTTSGALQVRGGIGVTGTGYFDVVRTRAIVTTGDVTIAGNFVVNGSTIDFGNAITDSISFIGRVDTDIDPITNNTYDLGTPGLAYRNAAIGNSLYFTNSTNTNTFAFTAGATGATLTYILPIDTPTAGQVLAASAISGDKVTLSWEDDQTGAPAGGITTLNTLTAASQSFATGTSGTDFAISSATSTHIFNLPDAGSSARGVVSTGTQTLAGAKTFSSALTVSDATTSTSITTGALKITGGVGIGGSLYTSTGSSSSVSGVILANGNVSATTYNKLTLSAPASSATLSLADGSTLATSGAFSLTFTTTATTNVTLPTSGTLVNTAVTSLSSLTSASSLNTVGTITSGTWSATAITGFYGGTGYNSYSTGDILVGAGNTFIKLSSGATNYVLTSNGANTVPSWQAVPAASAASVAVAPTTVDQSFFITTVSTSNGSGLGLSTITSFVVNPNTRIVSVSGMAVTSQTATTSTSTGALTVAGGVGIGQTLYVGGSIYAGAGASILNAPLYTNTIQIGAGGNNLNFLDATGATIGNFNTSNGWFRSAQTTESTSTSTGALVSLGGLGIAKNAFIGGTTTVTSSQVSVGTNSGALVVTGGVGIGGSLYTGTGSASSISGVVMSNGALTATTVNKLTLTAPATSATLTLANGSSLITSGANSLTFTTTTTTNVTLPSAGTLTTTGNKLNVFASTSSSELAGIISDKTGSGALVFATSPDFTTSMTTSSATFSLLNATATTINAFGAATTLSVGAATGTFTHNSTDNSTTISTGSLVVAGGAGFAKSLNIGQGINLWNGANYTGFKSAASTSIQYTLPPSAPSGTGTSFLSASTTGVMAWVAAPTGGGSGTINSSDVNNIAYYSGSTTISGDSVASGNIFQWRGTSTGLNIAHTDNEFTPSGSTKLLTVGTGATNYSTVRKALAVFSTNASWTNGDLLILGVGSNAADVRLGIDWRGHVAIGTPGTGFTLPIANGTSGQVLTANTNGVASWTTVSGSGGGVAAGTAGSIAIYNSTGTGISGSGAIQVAASGTAVSTFAHLDVKTGNDLRLWNTGNTFYTALGAGNNSSNYTLLYPTAPVGAGSSIVVIGSDGQMYFATAGSGIAFSSANANTPEIRTKRAFTIQFCAGYTPTSAGADSVIIKIPESANDGVSDITYRLREFDIRVETPSAGPSRIQLEKYSGTTAFTYAATGSSLIAGFGVTLTGAAIYTTSVSSNTFAGTLVTSNDKLRLNWTLLNATHANFSVQLTIEEV
jgi:hypothetical protein